MFLKIAILLYADDTVLIADTHRDMQLLLDYFSEYCNTWKLKINIDKTKSMIFGKCRKKKKFIINNLEIEKVDYYKYLGVFFYKNGKFIFCMKKLVQLAKKALFVLRKKSQSLNLPIDCQLKLFDQTIVPILTYACEIWGYKNLNIIEKVHTDFLRTILNVKKSTPLYMLYGELGRCPLSIHIKSRIIGYWARLILGKKEKLSYKLYEIFLYHLKDGAYVNSWLMNVKNILDNVGLSYVWNSQQCVNSKWIVASVKTTLYDQFLQKWNSDINMSSKGTNYKSFKTQLCLEKYMITLLPKHYIPIIKIRTSNHHLPIGTGRWNSILRNLRKCTFCNRNELGDEYHYLFVCEFFNDSRLKFIPKYYTNRHNMLKYEQLLNTTKRNVLIKLSRFITIVNNYCKSYASRPLLRCRPRAPRAPISW